MRRVWQVGAGDSGRDFSRLCLDHDVMVLGPGKYGPYDADVYSRVVSGGDFTGRKIGLVADFCHEVQPGDLVLLRRGQRAVALGIVADDHYRHDPTFDDIYGWDLEHSRAVIWQEHLAEELALIQAQTLLFPSRQMAMFTGVQSQDTLSRVAPLVEQCVTRPLKSRPDAPPEPLTLEEVGAALFSMGLANSAVDQVQKAIERQRRLLLWYRQHGKTSDRPDEHEVVAHMVLPLLLALGWSEQLLAVEWHKVDLAGFWGTPTTADRCVLVCEAKGLNHGLQDVLKQAKRYTSELALEECRKILLTQGGRFYLYRRAQGGSWPDEPSGYLNVEKIRTNHIAPAGTNAVETLMALTPAGVHRL